MLWYWMTAQRWSVTLCSSESNLIPFHFVWLDFVSFAMSYLVWIWFDCLDLIWFDCLVLSLFVFSSFHSTLFYSICFVFAGLYFFYFHLLFSPLSCLSFPPLLFPSSPPPPYFLFSPSLPRPLIFRTLPNLLPYCVHYTTLHYTTLHRLGSFWKHPINQLAHDEMEKPVPRNGPWSWEERKS